jgi:hypothetical protein
LCRRCWRAQTLEHLPFWLTLSILARTKTCCWLEDCRRLAQTWDRSNLFGVCSGMVAQINPRAPRCRSG